MARQTKNQDPIDNADDAQEIVKVVARRLREARTKSGVTQATLADLAGVKPTYIYELEYGTGNPTIKTLFRMARALGIDIRDLFPGPPLTTPTGGDLKHLFHALDDMVVRVNEHLSNEHLRNADEKRRNETESARRRTSELTLIQELQSFAELRDGLGRILENRDQTES